MRIGVLGVFLGAVLSLPSSGLAGEGFVALQTADPSCPDESGNTYVDCDNGTVTDNRTGLVWLKNAFCFNSQMSWLDAMAITAGLADLSGNDPDDCGLSDGSSPGEWRLPTKADWEAMVGDANGVRGGLTCNPAITNDEGTACSQEGAGSSFTNVFGLYYCSSTTVSSDWTKYQAMLLSDGGLDPIDKTLSCMIWPVRGGQ